MSTPIHPLDPSHQKTVIVNSGSQSFIAQVFCVNQDGGDFSIMRDVEYDWKEVPDGIEVEAVIYEDFSEFACGIPEDLKEQLWEQIAERHFSSITNLTISYK